ncbi:hypothetical protein HYPSUDRAFT_48530 [Hypholoma sublateritium FD-334 SS-4]|uniref:Uncharacterized protein n=1 Tax=Hypholoma sublateritium (strain FD-334 SS-4) TaxID=945553 RepID=A0A0D2P487_HYPSF|nr:hypothetical protein HYPSUDRAFT_48530 [Hypholoma sublateritium FD-334 SS-4]
MDTVDPRFNRPAPSPFKRAGLLLLIAALVWIALQMRSGLLEAKRKPQIIYASRYSKEHKYRPAASPIITETLKDGRIRLRGAIAPTATSTPPVVKKKGSGKGKSKKRAKSQKAAKKRP